MAQTKIKAGLFEGIIGNGTDGYFLMSNGDGTMTWSSIIINPTITSIAYPGSVTAADPAGGETITLTGTGFKTGATVTIGGTAAPAVSYVSETQITFTTPAKAAGDYDIVFTNTDTGSATYINGISYNGIPSWTTAAGSLGTFASGATISTITLQATEPDAGTITFNITNGALPTGLSLTGANIDGTTSLETADTLYTFTVTATDDESQATPRTFTITVKKEFKSVENFTINTYTGNGSTQSIEGKIGTAASFNGTNYIVTPELGDRNTFSYSLWVYMTNASAASKFIFGEQIGGQLYVNNGLLKLWVDADATFSGSPTLSNNTWHHIVLSVSSGTATVYLDNVNKGTASLNNVAITAPLYMGTASTQVGNNTYAMQGKMDQVRIFNKAISSSEVTTLYGENNTSTTKSTTDIFDDGSGVALYEFEKGAKDTGGVNGYIGSAGMFNGSSSKIDTGYTLPNSTFSVSVWFNTTDSIGPIIGDNDASGTGASDREGFALLTNKVSLNKNDAEVGSHTFATELNDGNWRHVVITNNGTTCTIYVDGSQDGTINSTTWTDMSVKDIHMGYTQRSPIVNWLNGKIDQVRIFNKALSSSEVTTLYGETSASATKSTTDIFNDGSGVALYELEGNANDTGWGAIDSGQSAVFNGSSSYIDLGNSLMNNYESNNFSFSCWFNLPSTVINANPNIANNPINLSQNCIFTKADYISGAGLYGFIYGIENGEFAIAQGTSSYDGYSAKTSGASLSADIWHHVVITKTSSNVYNVYIDGSLQTLSVSSAANGTFTTNANSRSAYITHMSATTYGDPARYTEGKIDQVRIYSSVLSASDVEALVSEINVPTANLVAHYKLDGNANDETGSYNGTATSITYSDPAEFPTYDGTATNVTYGYDGTPTNVSFVGTSFQPDLVWIKSRSNATNNELHDSLRGEPSRLFSDANNAEMTVANGFVSLDSNGFSLDGAGSGGEVNYSGRTYVAWCWKAASSDSTNTDGTITSTVRANQAAGFSVVKYTGNNIAGATIGHGLSSAPDMIIVKNLDTTDIWTVQHSSLGYTQYIDLSSTNAAATNSSVWYAAPTSTTFSFGANPRGNGSGNDIIAYCFHSVDGYQKVGSYTGDGGSSNAINLGFQPRWVMIKLSSHSGQNWYIMDDQRENTSVEKALSANSSAAEETLSNHLDFTSTGFTLTKSSGAFNTDGYTYIYLAIA